jgi:hypothetical protein
MSSQVIPIMRLHYRFKHKSTSVQKGTRWVKSNPAVIFIGGEVQGLLRAVVVQRFCLANYPKSKRPATMVARACSRGQPRWGERGVSAAVIALWCVVSTKAASGPAKTQLRLFHTVSEQPLVTHQPQSCLTVPTIQRQREAERALCHQSLRTPPESPHIPSCSLLSVFFGGCFFLNTLTNSSPPAARRAGVDRSATSP